MFFDRLVNILFWCFWLMKFIVWVTSVGIPQIKVVVEVQADEITFVFKGFAGMSIVYFTFGKYLWLVFLFISGT